jgi:flagellar motor switch protein FliN/FliY
MSEPTVANQDLIFEIPLSLAVEVGRTTLTIRELLRLGVGSVVALDRLAGEPLDIRVNGRLVSRGEMVTINDRYGVRPVDVQRMDSLGGEQSP